MVTRLNRIGRGSQGIPGVGGGVDFMKNLVAITRTLQSIKREKEEGPLRQTKQYLDTVKLARELQGPSPREKESYERSKHIFTQLKETLTNAKTSPATRSYLGELMESHFFGLSPQFQALLRPLAAGTPLDERTKKLDWFNKNFPAPSPPREGDDPRVIVNKLFAGLDYQREKKSFMGIAVGQKDKSVSLGEGYFGYRDTSGKISMLNADDENLREIAKGYNTTAEAILLAGGKWHTGPWMSVKDGDERYHVRPTINVIEQGDKGYEQAGVTDVQSLTTAQGQPVVGYEPKTKPQPKGMKATPSPISNLLLAIGARNSDNKSASGVLATQFHKAVSEGPADVQQFIKNVLAPAFNGWGFGFRGKIEKNKWTGWVPGIDDYSVAGDDWALVPYPFTQYMSFTDVHGVERIFPYNAPTDVIYSSVTGQNAGSLDTFRQRLATGDLTFGGGK